MDGADNTTNTREVVTDTLAQDMDKMITTDMMRLDFDSSLKILYLDSDELLAPSSILQPPYIYFKNQHDVNHTMSTLKDLVRKRWSGPSVNAEYFMYRMGVSAWTPSKVVHVRAPWVDGDVVGTSTQCMLQGELIVYCPSVYSSMYKLCMCVGALFLSLWDC